MRPDRQRARGAGVRFVSDVTHETESTPSHRPYEPLLGAGVADGPPRGAHPAGERIVRHDSPIPHGTDELVFADHTVPVPHEMDQHVEHLRLDVDDRAFSMQLTPIAVDFAVAEYKGHVPASMRIRTFSGKPPAFVQDTSRPAAALSRS